MESPPLTATRTLDKSRAKEGINMAQVREEETAKEITVAIVSKLAFGGDPATRADQIGEAAGKIYAKIIKAVEAANR